MHTTGCFVTAAAAAGGAAGAAGAAAGAGAGPSMPAHCPLKVTASAAGYFASGSSDSEQELLRFQFCLVRGGMGVI